MRKTKVCKNCEEVREEVYFHASPYGWRHSFCTYCTEQLKAEQVSRYNFYFSKDEKAEL